MNIFWFGAEQISWRKAVSAPQIIDLLTNVPSWLWFLLNYLQMWINELVPYQ